MQFEFLVTTERKYFLCKNGNPPPWKKSPPSSPATPPLKIDFQSSPSLFENLVGGLNPPGRNGQRGERGGGGAHYVNVFWLVLECCSIMHKAWWLEKHWHTWKNWCKDFKTFTQSEAKIVEKGERILQHYANLEKSN